MNNAMWLQYKPFNERIPGPRGTAWSHVTKNTKHWHIHPIMFPAVYDNVSGC